MLAISSLTSLLSSFCREPERNHAKNKNAEAKTFRLTAKAPPKFWFPTNVPLAGNTSPRQKRGLILIETVRQLA